MNLNYERLAELLTEFSISVKKNENVLIDAFDIPDEMVIALVRAIRKKKAIPFVQTHHASIHRELTMNGEETLFKTKSINDLAFMKKMDAYIALRGSDNIFEMSDVPPVKMKLAMKYYRTVLNQRVNKTKWVILRWPTPSMAQQSFMSTEAFEEFFFRVCTLNYKKMIPGMNALKQLMNKTDLVHIEGPGTDLKFSIKGIAAIECGGKHNIPDGEVFTAPVKTSVEGVITYNAPTVYEGTSFENVQLTFKNGKIIKATSSNTKRLNEILDADPGARYVGEFAIGFNPHILHPMRDILFDEKIGGSFHFTPGQAYEEADNGNRSQIHWDLVNIQRPDYGGGTIKFDGKVIRKNGLFTNKALEKLNPTALLK